jgi:N-acetyl sugar amidotransferase
MQTQCKTCVLDGSAPEIVLTETGCNFCDQARKSLKDNEAEKDKIPQIIRKIKGKKYDCLIGLSGGLDSSMVLHHAVRLGLKPLCFGMDNGYNNPKADENVLRMVEKLKVPYIRHEIDKKKFADLQSAFMKAGLKNIEIPTDHIIMAVTYEIAVKYGIKWILSGGNTATESIMPPSWGYSARDLTHIKDVYKKMTGRKLSGLPTCGLLKWNYYKWIKGMKMLYLLDYLDYNRAESVKLLEQEYGWKDYGAKHEESIFTQWFQNFYLFEKFGIDKRKAHLSSLIASGQMTRSQALFELGANPVYPKLGIETKVLQYPKREHEEFKQDEWLFNLISKIVRKIKFLTRT